MGGLVAEGAREIPNTKVRLRKIDREGALRATPEDVLWAVGVAVGSPTDIGIISWKMKSFRHDKIE
jgi:NAD(P)H dehydrogenase (quinone)